MTGDCCVFKLPQRCVNGKHLMRFQCENAMFLRRNVDWGLVYHLEKKDSIKIEVD